MINLHPRSKHARLVICCRFRYQLFNHHVVNLNQSSRTRAWLDWSNRLDSTATFGRQSKSGRRLKWSVQWSSQVQSASADCVHYSSRRKNTRSSSRKSISFPRSGCVACVGQDQTRRCQKSVGAQRERKREQRKRLREKGESISTSANRW